MIKGEQVPSWAGLEFERFPQVQEMFHPGEFELRTFIKANVSAIEAAAIASLIWPEFVEYRGGVFLRLLFDRAGIDRWFSHYESTIASVESAANHLHLWESFSAQTVEDRDALSAIGKVMSEVWPLALAARFRHRRFEVAFSDEPIEYGPTLSLFSVDS